MPIKRCPGRNPAANGAAAVKTCMALAYPGCGPGSQAQTARLWSGAFCLTGLPMALDAATTRRIAKLARLRIEEGEVAHLQTELNGILGWIEQLRDVNVEGVTPMAGGAETGSVLAPRADVVTDGGYPDRLLANAPGRDGAFFTVPKVVE
jgi:aspartyl-tRNA(Asn)/glutamyl-tRNA(Gln) amidotransferase subunit C